MKKSLVILAMLACIGASAETLVARRGADEVRLLDQPCTNQTVVELTAPYGGVEAFQKAEATMDGQRYEACWRPAGEMFHLLYEDGDQGLVPVREAKPEMGA